MKQKFDSLTFFHTIPVLFNPVPRLFSRKYLWKVALDCFLFSYITILHAKYFVGKKGS